MSKKEFLSSEELFQLAEITIELLLSHNVGTNIKVHLEQAFTSILNEDTRNKANNVKISEGLLEDFVLNKLRIDEAGMTLEKNSQVLSQYEPNGVLKTL